MVLHSAEQHRYHHTALGSYSIFMDAASLHHHSAEGHVCIYLPYI